MRKRAQVKTVLQQVNLIVNLNLYQMSEISNTIRNLKGARNVAAVVGLLDSAYGIGAATYGQTMQLFGVVWVAAATAVVITSLLAYLVDVGLHANSLTAMRGMINGGDGNTSPAFYWWVGFLCLIQLGFGVSSAIFTRSFAVDAVVTAPTTVDATGATQAQRMATAAQLSSIEGDISTLQKEKKTAVSNAGNATLRSMAASGNAWAIGQLSAAKNKAAGAFDKRIAQAMEAKNGLITTSNSTEATITAGIAAENGSKWGVFSQTRGKLNVVLLGVTLVCTVVFLITTIILAQYDGTPPKTQQEPPVKRTTKPVTQRTTATGNVTDNGTETRYNAATDGNAGQQRNTPTDNVTGEHGKVMFDKGQYLVFLHTPSGAKWYKEETVTANLRTYKGHYLKPGTRDIDNVKKQMDAMAAGVAAIKAVKTANATS